MKVLLKLNTRVLYIYLLQNHPTQKLQKKKLKRIIKKNIFENFSYKNLTFKLCLIYLRLHQ